VICLCGDGDMQEGVASEACALAGHWGLDNLIYIYDSNAVTLDAAAEGNAERRHRQTDGSIRSMSRKSKVRHATVSRCVERGEKARQRKTAIHHRAYAYWQRHPEVEGTYKAHGEAARNMLMLRARRSDCPRNIISSRRRFTTTLPNTKRNSSPTTKSGTNLQRVAHEKSGQGEVLDDGLERKVPADLLSKIPDFSKDAKLATRKAGGDVLQPLRNRCRCS